MHKSQIYISSQLYAIEEEFNNSELANFKYRDLIEFPGKGGDWNELLPLVVNNEITINLLKEIAPEIALLTIKILYNHFKNKKSSKPKAKNAVYPGGNLVIKIEIDGVNKGAISKENIENVNYDFMEKLMKSKK